MFEWQLLLHDEGPCQQPNAGMWENRSYYSDEGTYVTALGLMIEADTLSGHSPDFLSIIASIGGKGSK